MARLATCKCCGVKLQPEEKYKYNSKTYCKKCYENVAKNGEAYKNLIQFICENFEIERPTGIMLKQIKEFKNEYHYTYAAMTYTLWYAKEILNKKLLEKYGLVLIKYYYEDAKNYYTQQENSIRKMKILKNKEMKIKIIKHNNTQNHQVSNSLMNLENLAESGDKY